MQNLFFVVKSIIKGPLRILLKIRSKNQNRDEDEVIEPISMKEIMSHLGEFENEIYEKATQEDIELTEKAIGVKLPDSYKNLLKNLVMERI